MEESNTEKHPYISGAGAITAMVTQFRKSLPGTIDADTLRKLGIAPNNESYAINVLRFIGVIDAEGKRTPEAVKVFHADDEAFRADLGTMIKKAYGGLFELHPDPWTLDQGKLVSYFRTTDKVSAIVGRRQATTFRALGALAGHGEMQESRKSSVPRNRDKTKTPLASGKQPATNRNISPSGSAADASGTASQPCRLDRPYRGEPSSRGRSGNV